MKVRKKWMILAVLFLIINMIAATQYAVTKIGYEYNIIHPCDANIRLIGSDNSSDNIRVLRIIGSNTTDVGLKLRLGGNFTTNQIQHFTAAFGIVNEESRPLNITHINVSSENHTYLQIYLHGDRDANGNSTLNDNSTVYMWNNNTMVNLSNTTAWTLATGDGDTSTMCYNVTNRAGTTINTDWDETAHVRYSLNNSNAVSSYSDFVWVQITINIPDTADALGLHTGTIWIHLESEPDES